MRKNKYLQLKIKGHTKFDNKFSVSQKKKLGALGGHEVKALFPVQPSPGEHGNKP